MKKSLKPMLVFVILLLTSTGLIILGYVGTKLECEVLVKGKIDAQEKLEAQLNKKIEYTAEYQLLNSEERIVKIAQEELGMFKDSTNTLRLVVSNEEVNRISDVLGADYD